MRAEDYGFVGLGQMGQPIASNIAKGGFALQVYDQAGTQARAPEGARIAGSTANLAAATDTIFVCVPDGRASRAVAEEIAAAPSRRVRTVVDLSTIGIAAAEASAAVLEAAGIAYVDAPISGGRKGAIAGTITVMWAGPRDAFDASAAVLKAFAGTPVYVGPRPGQGQALKLLNNFLSATAMAATTEAVLFGLSQGLDMKTMLDTVNVSTGMNTATRDKFPEQILTEKFAAGFAMPLMTKDVTLFMENVARAGTPSYVAERVVKLFQAANAEMPDRDFTSIYEFVREGGEERVEEG